MNHSKTSFLMLPLLLVIGLLPPAHAKEPKGQEAYGMVKAIESGKMTVTVYDVEKNQAREETFTLAPDTQLAILRPASEVIEGDEVKITYSEEKGNKKAQFVSIIDLPNPVTQEAPQA